MAVEVYLIILLFALALSAFITAINARGTVRIILSYVLAFSILLAAVFASVKYRQTSGQSQQEAEKIRMMEQLKMEQEIPAKAALEKAAADSAASSALAAQTAQPPADSAGIAASGISKPALLSLINQGAAVASGILAINVDNKTEDYDPIIAKSNQFKSQAADLQARCLALQVDPVLKPIREAALKGFRSLSVAANYFNLYFKAESSAEEDERYDVYKQNAMAARDELTRASARLR